MKTTVLPILLCLLPLSLWAQLDTTNINRDTTWTSSIQLGFNFNQASFSSNWTGGGISSIALGSIFNYRLHYNKNAWSWDSEVEFLYGVIKSQGQGTRKSQDRILFDTKAGYSISEFWQTFFAVNFLSQFAPGYQYPENAPRILISNFMAPGFLTASVGLEYQPNENFWIRFSPFAPRLTFVTDTNVAENYGVQLNQGETVRYEILASQLSAELSRDITDILNVKSRYMLFANYETLAFNTIDHRLDVTLTAKLTEYINLNVAGIMVYDKDQAEQTQYSQLLGVGVSFQR